MKNLKWWAKKDQERGDQALSLVIWTTVLIILLCGVIALVRSWSSNTNIDQAAQAAARDASLTRTPEQASIRGRLAAEDWVKIQGSHCTNLAISVDTSGYRVPLGQTGFVQVTITCTISFSDLYLPGMPGQTTITKTGLSPIDPYRERQ